VSSSPRRASGAVLALFALLLVAIHPILSSPTSHVLVMILFFLFRSDGFLFLFLSYSIPPIDEPCDSLHGTCCSLITPALFLFFLLSHFLSSSPVFLWLRPSVFCRRSYTILITITITIGSPPKKYCSLIPKPPPVSLVWFSSVCYCMCS